MNRSQAHKTSIIRILSPLVFWLCVSPTLALPPGVIPAKQGPSWSDDLRLDFYSRDQGSRVIPLRWIINLKQPNGLPFMDDSLSRYGYLRNEKSIPSGLPVGFMVASTASGEVLGMTCSACHTRDLNVAGKTYRIDGGPALADFQHFLSDLNASVEKLLTDPMVFSTFANAILGPSPMPQAVNDLRASVQSWHEPYTTLMTRALPTPPWGPGRLDAVSMIFNRLTGLDIGPVPTHLLPANIHPADAPVRYPFLWNSTRQDKTQWPGFASNGNSILGVARNLGEVLGVFAVFHPTEDPGHPLGINYVDSNSVNFQGLEALERMVRAIGPPKWPWPVDTALAKEGHTVFDKTCAHMCHEKAQGAFRSPLRPSWATPILNVGTDTREWYILARKVDPGVLTGAQILGVTEPLANPSLPRDVLGLAVIGTVIQHAIPVGSPLNDQTLLSFSSPIANSDQDLIRRAFRPEKEGTPGSYEARVLYGIWAAAPYLHNGSVRTLADLLKPAESRAPFFSVGSAYDVEKVGVAKDQDANAGVIQTTGCEDLNSGSSRCGHEYGTNLPDHSKKALLEYLKTL